MSEIKADEQRLLLNSIPPDVISHLNKLILMNLKGTPLSGVASFQQLSCIVKRNRFQYKEGLPQAPKRPDSHALLLQALKQQKLQSEQAQVQSLISNKLLLEAAGVGLDHDQAALIEAAMIQLSNNYKATGVRFWGRLKGRKDYYVIQGIPSVSYGDGQTKGWECRGEGINGVSYWVTTSLLSQWRQLPLIGPNHIKAAREIVYLVKGELQSQLNTYPPFPGKQKHFLKAQIVRLTHACEIVPKGLMKPGDENPKVLQYEEEFKMGEPADFLSLENWVHLQPYILRAGRCSQFIDPSLPEEAKEALLAQLAQKDPDIQRLKAINEDKPMEKIAETLWLSKLVGEPQAFNQVGTAEGSSCAYSTAILRNFAWPGWLTVASNRGFLNIYTGYGLKTGQLPFYPVSPSDMIVEPDECTEHREPNPEKEPPPPPEANNQDAPPPQDDS